MRMYYGEACKVASESWEHDTETLRKALAVIEGKRGLWTQSDLLDMSTLEETIEIREWN